MEFTMIETKRFTAEDVVLENIRPAREIAEILDDLLLSEDERKSGQEAEKLSFLIFELKAKLERAEQMIYCATDSLRDKKKRR
ncbi:MAG TPA: hypothetical protein PKM95_09065 [Deltaproteobacteria bacterium]|jgi:hypothetical protein|nr:hypothetical protein [Deltaproteobacteria bacterium]